MTNEKILETMTNENAKKNFERTVHNTQLMQYLSTEEAIITAYEREMYYKDFEIERLHKEFESACNLVITLRETINELLKECRN